MNFRSTGKDLDGIVIPFLMGLAIPLGVLYACSNAVFDGVQWKFYYRLFGSDSEFGFRLLTDMLLAWYLVFTSMLLLFFYASFIFVYLFATRLLDVADTVVGVSDTGLEVDSGYMYDTEIFKYADIEEVQVFNNKKGNNIVRLYFTEGSEAFENIGGRTEFIISDFGLDKLKTRSELFSVAPKVSSLAYMRVGFVIFRYLSDNIIDKVEGVTR